MNPPSESVLDVAIIGAGFSGLGLAIRLRQLGRHRFRVFEREPAVGGTWWVNRYPGCACDVPSRLYSYSFAPNPGWSRRFAPAAEIQRYLADCVERFEIRPQLELECEIRQAAWDDSRKIWTLEATDGRRWQARVLVAALGGLSRPLLPDIPGIRDFQGQVFHSQAWPDDFQAEGRQIAVIGTGATAVQLVPRLATSAARLDVYQRTPNWILPRPDRAIGPGWRRLYHRLPWLGRLARGLLWSAAEIRVPALVWNQRLAWFHRRLALKHLKRQVHDPEIRQRLTPDYAMGCKRVLLSSDYYPAFNRPHVELVTDPIDRIESDAIVDSRGRSRTIDTLVLATGFRATAPVPKGLIKGRDGRDLATSWRGGPEAYKGTTVHGFPNLFTLVGPNTAIGHNSLIYIIESQIDYVLDALKVLDRQGASSVEVRAQAQADYNRWLELRLAGSVWNSGGCRSWYLHPETGRNSSIWPGFLYGFRRQTRRFDLQSYQLVEDECPPSRQGE